MTMSMSYGGYKIRNKCRDNIIVSRDFLPTFHFHQICYGPIIFTEEGESRGRGFIELLSKECRLPVDFQGLIIQPESKPHSQQMWSYLKLNNSYLIIAHIVCSAWC